MNAKGGVLTLGVNVYLIYHFTSSPACGFQYVSKLYIEYLVANLSYSCVRLDGDPPH